MPNYLGNFFEPMPFLHFVRVIGWWAHDPGVALSFSIHLACQQLPVPLSCKSPSDKRISLRLISSVRICQQNWIVGTGIEC